MPISVFELDLSFEESVQAAETLSKSPSGSLKDAIAARFLHDQQNNPYVKGEVPIKFSFSRSAEQTVSRILFVQAYKQPDSKRSFSRVIEKTFKCSKQPCEDNWWGSDMNDDKEVGFPDFGK